MKDITKERKHKDQIHNAQIEAARMADKLVEEQLKIVQQIAGLLGETAADTKVAVEKNFSVGTVIRLKKMMKTMFWCFLTDLGAE